MTTVQGRVGGAAALAAAAVLLGAAATAGAAGAWTLRFTFVPERVFQGRPAVVSVLVTPKSRQCVLAVRYADGSSQPGLHVVHASAGLREWSWTVGETAAAGAARATVSCGRSGTLSRAITVVGGTVRHSKLAISAQGFSQRPASYGSGSSVSYGIVLDNPSKAEDAENVSVLVNFLDGAGHVLQSATTTVPAIAAAGSFDLGGAATLPSQAPVARLEVVVQTGSYAPRALHEPAVENVQIAASSYDPNWVGVVNGELVNDHPTDVLEYAQLSIVLYDASGHVVGGGTGSIFAALPPGTRSYFSASSGLSSVPLEQASVAAISIEPTYTKPGA
jgi:hypothetical protein